MILKIIAWTLWLLFLISAISYMPGLKEAQAQKILPTDIDTGDWFSKLAIILSIVAIIEASITVALRNYILLRPAKKGTFSINSLSGSTKFIVVSTINWLLANSIIVYGLVLFIMSNRIEFFYTYFIAGLALMIFHTPRLSPYEVKN